MADPFLIAAYGMFWQANEVNWTPGLGKRWQMLGRRGRNSPSLRVCDFRAARGFYILFDDHGANYVGLARGQHGIGSRLVTHFRDLDKQWSRFCWFSFDEVVDVDDLSSGWSCVKQRDAIDQVDAETTVRELEALLIAVLGARYNKAQMRFVKGEPWEQITIQDCQPGGALTKVARQQLADSELSEYVTELN